MRAKLHPRLSHIPPGWAGLFLVTFLLAHLYVLLEWVFQVTMPSFLDLYPWLDKIEVLLFSSVLVAGVCLLGLGFLFLLGRLPGLRRFPRLFYWLGSLLPATLLGALLLLLIDNFTYTLFSFGIATTPGAWRGLYTALFWVLLIWSVWEVLGAAAWLNQRLSRPGRPRVRLWVGSGIWMAAWLMLPFAVGMELGNGLEAFGGQLSSRPHILWITADGLSAEHLSLYGYKRDTTPNLRQLAATSLVAENAFVNADKTAGSLVSMLTGQHPLQTRLLYPPDILMGAESYQHLPGILRAQGYYAVQYGLAYYVDAYKINMLDSFDFANGRALDSGLLPTALQKYLPGKLVYFLSTLGSRVTDRLGHIFFITTMPAPMTVAVSPARNQSDTEKVEALLDSLDQFNQPMFIHLHLLAAHGPVFSPEQKVFSRGLAFTDQGEWNPYFYDDAILGLDADIGAVVSALQSHGLLDETILIIGSDHAMAFDQLQRVPLLIRFPGGQITGRIQQNVQGLDIAPTILDYLGLDQPAWMVGQSLLDQELAPRLIFGAGVGPLMQNEKEMWVTGPQRTQPPFYQFGALSVIDCQVWYELDLTEMRMTSGEVAGHTAPCPAEAILTPAQAYTRMMAYLRENGFDVAGLEGLVPARMP